MNSNQTIVIGGPTASGKSALALAVAAEFGGVVINGDSMQVYRGLPIVTACPSTEDEAQVPHRLYQVLDPAEVCSMGRWLDMARAEVAAAHAAGKLPVVVGGTGLYLRALVQGVSPVPEIPDEVRAQARGLFAELGNECFHARLTEVDPVMAGRLHPGNSQRLVRAWEVLQATGRSLADWQAMGNEGGLAGPTHVIALLPERERLYAACDGRFRKMVAAGALDEVASLAARKLDPALPAMKALGVPELMAHLRGELDLEAAILSAQQATRNYAKRQLTWFRHQIVAQMALSAQDSKSAIEETFSNVRRFLLTGAA